MTTRHTPPRRSGSTSTVGAGTTDAALVSAHLAGDRAALGALYDRFGAGLYDTARAMLRDPDGAADVVQEVFCVAAVKLPQLRDHSRVKPWLYAIARHEIYRRTKQRGRQRSLDAILDEWGNDPVAAPDPMADAGGAEAGELAELVRAAAAGLDEQDQLVLELSARQGLVGADLAAAMSVSVRHAHTLVFRMRERLERAVGAYIVTRGKRDECAELERVLAGWDGTFDVLWRKRIARHIDGCETCQVTRRGAAVLSLAGGAPAFAAPLWLRQRTLDAAHAALDAAAGGAAGGAGHGVAAVADSAGRHHTGYRWDRRGFPRAARALRPVVWSVLGALVVPVAIVTSLFMQGGTAVTGSVIEGIVAPTSTSTTSTTTSTTSSSTTTSSTSSTTTSDPPVVVVAPPEPQPQPQAPAQPPPNDPPPSRSPQTPPTSVSTAPPTMPPTAPPTPRRTTVPTTPTTEPNVVGVPDRTTTPTTAPVVLYVPPIPVVFITTTTTIYLI